MNYKNIFSYLIFLCVLGCVQSAPAVKKKNRIAKDQRAQLSYRSFFSACENGQLELVADYIEQGININVENVQRMKPLHIACMFGHMDVVRLLVKNGADINAKTNHLLTPLHCAVYCGDVSIVRHLLNAGADSDAQTGRGYTALDIAYQYERLSIIELFSDESGEVAIIESFSNQHDENACYLSYYESENLY